MKNHLAFCISAVFAAGSLFILPGSVKKAENGPGAPMVNGADGELSERSSWELMRLADPLTGIIPYGIRKLELAYAATLPNDGNPGPNAHVVANWNQRGPWNVGGRTRSFAIDKTNENIILAGSTSGGIWRSTDQGTTWGRTTTNAQNFSVTSLVQDVRTGHTNKWYYSTGEGYGQSAGSTGAYYLGNGIYKSTDGGLTWNSLTVTATNTPHTFDSGWDIIWDLAMDSSNVSQDEIYAARYGGISRSTDGGATWATVRGGNPNCYFADVDVSPSGIVYATMSDDGIHKGIWRSPDGVSWTKITPPNFPAAYDRLEIGIAPGDENQVWFLGHTPGFGQPDTNFVGTVEWNSLWKYRFLSGDGDSAGGVWEDHSQFLPTTGGLFDKFSCQGSYDLVVKIHPADTNIVFIGGTNLYRSNDGFNSLTNTTFIGGYQQGATLPVVDMYTNHHPDQHHLEFLPSNDLVMFSTNDGGVFKTSDCLASTVSWTSLNNGYLTTMFYTVAIDHAVPGNNVIVAGAQDNGSWFTNNSTLTSPWSTPRGGDGSYCAIADNQSMYYLSIQNGKMMKASLDANGNVQNYARIDPIGATGYQFINPYVLDPNNSNNLMYLAAGKYIWRNDDLGGIPLINNWDSISTNWTRFNDSVSQVNTKITAVTISKTPANRLYFGTSSKKLYRIDNANIGNPVKTDITSTSTSAVFPTANIGCVAVNPNNADEMLVCFTNYNIKSVFYSGTGGLPTSGWQHVGGNLDPTNNQGPSVRWAAIIPVSDGTVYLLATSTGLYATDTLMGASTVWVQQGTNTIGNAVVDMIDFRSSDGLVVIATHSYGIFSTTITSVNDITTVDEIEVPNSPLQLSVFPNPSQGNSTMSFFLDAAVKVKVSLMDIHGKLIETLDLGTLSGGTQYVPISLPEAPPGVYFAIVRAGAITETKRILIIR